MKKQINTLGQKTGGGDNMNKKTYVVSTVVPGSTPYVEFIDSLQNYCKLNDAELLLIKSAPMYKKDIPHNFFKQFTLHDKSFRLNRNIRISNIPINPEAVDPIQGLERQAQLQGSIIFASPKQRMKSIASPKSDFPRIAMTPGAVTHPAYVNTKRGMVAAKDHKYGAIIVEVENSRVYHYRQVQCVNKDGSFADLGVRYYPSKVKAERPEALTPGDWHCKFTDPNVRNVVIDIAKKLKPKILFLHDFFDGLAVNPHVEFKLLEKALMVKDNNLSEELAFAGKELEELSQFFDKTYVIKSNHDLFLDRWLSEAKYVRDNVNYIVGHKLAIAKAEGKDPLEYGMSMFGSKFKNTKFLKLEDSVTIGPNEIENGAHGHLGPNGSRGSASSLEKAYGSITAGHVHSPEILRDCFMVGTSTHLSLSYNAGSSSWMQTMCITYTDGSRQLINVIKGKYRN